VLTLSNELKDAVSSLLSAAVNRNTEQLRSILIEKMGEEFVMSNTDIIERFHVEQNPSAVVWLPPKQ